MTCCQVLHLNRDECLRQAEGGGRASGKPRVVDVPQASRGWWLCLRQAEGGGCASGKPRVAVRMMQATSLTQDEMR